MQLASRSLVVSNPIFEMGSNEERRGTTNRLFHSLTSGMFVVYSAVEELPPYKSK